MKFNRHDQEINWKRRFIIVGIIYLGGMVLAYFAAYFAHVVYNMF